MPIEPTVLSLDISHCNSREDIRKFVTETFLDEVAGKGNGVEISKYRYNVYEISEGKYIFLNRPAHLNKGFDFTVCVDDERFPSKPNKNGKITYSNRPSHYAILEDLKNKKQESNEKYRILLNVIKKIYNIKPITEEIPSFSTGYDVNMLLSIINWLFIEQDITYWNYSGRNMLMSGVLKISEETR